MDKHTTCVGDLEPCANIATLEGDTHIRGINNIPKRVGGYAHLDRVLFAYGVEFGARLITLAMLDAQYIIHVIDVKVDIWNRLAGEGNGYCTTLGRYDANLRWQGRVYLLYAVMVKGEGLILWCLRPKWGSVRHYRKERC